ncbi:hypothetical protein ACFV16_20895 [Streptomyces massasporeus]|uniref:hypothetical protein n=1 Tax=Streptomyces massasporeus TaxID=67324 RepID=UPI0036C0912A
MQMTEPFAATSAAVAPVILIAAGLEVASYQRTIQGWVSRLVEQVEPQVTAILEQSPAERRAAVRRLVEEHSVMASTGMLKAAVQFTLGILWVVVMMAQVAVTVVCLAWLGVPAQPPDRDVAVACLVAVAVGAFAVATFPMYRLIQSPWAPIVEWALKVELRSRLSEARGQERA